MSSARIGVVIPALDEEESIAHVVRDLPGIVEEIVVVDNGSVDGTRRAAQSAGATVLTEPRRGYGYACLTGVEHLAAKGVDVVVFLDGDYADDPRELPALVAPILRDTHDFVLGSRARGAREKGALLPQARAGNLFAGTFIRLFWGVRFTDLGPFRAMRIRDLLAMNMRELRYGWTVEMQIKAAKRGLRCLEIPVSYRRRIGQSKVTGTVRGTVFASARILGLHRTTLRKKLDQQGSDDD
ncbi:MAG: glycosyltransferase family 2 protein [Bacteroidota bacterium]|nr:glycosyltransferase family 2 protein [Bacteroidota bacterium]